MKLKGDCRFVKSIEIENRKSVCFLLSDLTRLQIGKSEIIFKIVEIIGIGSQLSQMTPLFCSGTKNECIWRNDDLEQ